MTTHRFNIGDRVRVIRPGTANAVEAFLNNTSRGRAAAPAVTGLVIRLRPADDEGFQYHVRDESGRELLVHEHQIVPD